MDDALVLPGTVFVSHDEVKQTVGQKRVLKVFLVDQEGKKHLAAIGEDLGDAHYHYRSTKPFSKYGVIDCHNRKELTMWLEMIIAESACKEGPHLDADEQNPEGVYFTSHKYERAHMSDGRRINRWYLVDQHGSAHLAVIGIERDTKDGHYTYSAEQPFADMIPLQCSNQSGVFKWLEKWITHHAAGAATQAQGTVGAAVPSGTASAGNAVSMANGSALDPAGRKPPLFISLSAIRQARKSASALLSETAMVVEPQARPKPKSKLAAGTPGAAQAAAPQPAVPKQKSLGIVQQNQIKKARKLQEDARAEQERLISGHLMRLRRAAAAELQGDNTAKQVSMSWVQGGLRGEELDAMQHWVTLLKAVLDLQQQHQQWQRQQEERLQCEQTGYAVEQQQQQHLQQQAQNSSFLQQELQQQQHQEQPPSASQGPKQNNTSPDEAAMTDKELLAWLRQPGNERHHLRVILECLKEIYAADLPARVLLGHKVIHLVQRCLSEPADESIKTLARHMLKRWRWQLAGHMQVMTNPAYMEDHLGVLEEEIAAGEVPVPQLPEHKQVLLNTPLPTLPGATSGRMHYTPQQHVNHHQQQQQHLAAPGSAPPALTDPYASHTPAQGAGGLLGVGSGAVSTGLLPPGLNFGAVGSQGFEGFPNPAGLGLLGHHGQLSTPGFGTPMAASAAALFRAGSPALGGVVHPSLLPYSCADTAAVPVGDVYGLNGASHLVTWPYLPAGVPVNAAGMQMAANAGMVPLHIQQQQLLGTFSMQPHQQYLQPSMGSDAAAQAAAGMLAQQQQSQQQWQQQWLSTNLQQLSSMQLPSQQAL